MKKDSYDEIIRLLRKRYRYQTRMGILGLIMGIGGSLIAVFIFATI